MAKFSILNFGSEKASLHQELINLGFAFVESTGLYLYEYQVKGGEGFGILLDSTQTMTYELAICNLGSEYFNKALTKDQRLESFKLSQKLMIAREIFFEASALPKASSQGN